MSVFAEEKAYVRRIERRFLALRGSGFVLSPRDFGLLLDWFHRGVPADLVTGAIEEVLKKAQERSRRPRVFSIAYCRHAVEDAWEERRRALVGAAEPGAAAKPAAFMAEDVAQHLAQAAASLAAAAEAVRTGPAGGETHPAAEAIASIAQRLSDLREGVLARPRESFAPLEDELVGLEAGMKAAARSLLSPAEVAEIASKTEARISPFADRMSAAARAATVARAVDAAILARLNLRRLSLFAMSL